MRWILIVICAALVPMSCTSPAARQASKTSSPSRKLGIRPDGDTTLHIDMSKVPDDLKKVYAYIDEHIDEHVENLQKWIHQPSISNSGEGIPESAEMVKGFSTSSAASRRASTTSASPNGAAPGNPVVYAKCDEGAPKTVAITGCTTPCRSRSRTPGSRLRSKDA